MNKSRLGAPLALCAVALVPAGLGCAISSGTQAAAPDETSSVVGGSSIPAAPATDAATDTPQPGSRSGLVEELDELADAPPEAEAVTGEGTDSVTTSIAPAPIDAATRVLVTDFGEHYLGFDYRDPADGRALALEPLVSESLLFDLGAPLPAALLEELATEQRVTEPTLVDVEPLGETDDGGRIIRSVFEVETSTISADDEAQTETETVVLTVVVGPDGVIEDVR